MSASVTVVAMDHIVLRCADVEHTLQWYQQTLGLAPVRVDEWRRGAAPFPSVRVNEHTIIDLIGIDLIAMDRMKGRTDDDGAADRLDHFCLVVEPVDLRALADSGIFDVVDGPDTRYGARGDGTSLYVRDPDGAVVELRHY